MTKRKRLTNNDVIGLVGAPASNYIQEIYDGTNTHAVAVKKGITFFNGSADTTGVVWDGVQELEVVIPTLADIVSNPVVLKGVINNDSPIPSTASNGDLYYIGADGVTIGDELCEAGDMAVYYNGWHVISGENQITINTSDGSTTTDNDTLFSISGTAKAILTVEGKTLSLNIDYTDVADKIRLTKNIKHPLSVTGGTVAVSGMSIGLKATTTSSQSIATEKSINLPTALANNAVSIAENVLEASNFTFTSGSFPSISKNTDAIPISASTNITVTGSFVTDVTAIGSVTLGAGSDTDKDLTYVKGLSAATGTSFVTGIREFDSENDALNTVIFEIPGNVSVTGTSTFATGFGAAAASGDVVSSVSVGAVTIGTGSDVVTGLSGEGNSVITGVSFGSAVQDNEASWFYSGLKEGSDVVTDVTVGAVTLVSGNDTAGMTASALVTASVSNHVLSFTTGTFMKPVDISQADSSVRKKEFTKTGVKLTGFTSTSDTFTKGGISQAETTVSYKSLTTDSINIVLGSATKFVADKAEDHAYTAILDYAKLTTTAATVSTGSPALKNTSITATIPSNTVAVDLNAGTLPSLSIGTATGKLIGTVDTSLTTSEVSWYAVASDAAIPAITTYTLTSDSNEITGTPITVAAANTYGVENAKVIIDSDTYVTGVVVNGSNAQLVPLA